MTDQVISLDPDLESADWTKAGLEGWGFPPYKSADFMAIVPDLDAFRKTPAYRYASEAGLICDDEWVADYCTPAKGTKDRRLHLHIY